MYCLVGCAATNNRRKSPISASDRVGAMADKIANFVEGAKNCASFLTGSSSPTVPSPPRMEPASAMSALVWRL